MGLITDLLMMEIRVLSQKSSASPVKCQHKTMMMVVVMVMMGSAPWFVSEAIDRIEESYVTLP